MTIPKVYRFALGCLHAAEMITDERSILITAKTKEELDRLVSFAIRQA